MTIQHELRQCEVCDGTGYSERAKWMHDMWYGKAAFHPEDRGSTPFAPSHPAIQARTETNLERSPEFYGTGPEAHHKEAIRLCNLFNAAWQHHLNQDDVDALVEAGRLIELTHTWDKEHGWVQKTPPFVPTAEEVNIWSISIGNLGHDAINQYVVLKAECKRRGIEDTCPHCKGEGSV